MTQQNRAMPMHTRKKDPNRDVLRPGKTAEDRMPAGQRPRVARAQAMRALYAKMGPKSTKVKDDVEVAA